jgi:PhoH-like ATPase
MIAIIDTNVIVNDPFFFLKLKNTDIVLPMIVLEELDKLKSAEGLVGKNSRTFIHQLKAFVQNNNKQDTNTFHFATDRIRSKVNDNIILDTALRITNKSKKSVTLYTHDINMQIKASKLKVKAKAFEFEPEQDVYAQSYIEMKVGDDAMELLSQGRKLASEKPLKPNQYILVNGTLPCKYSNGTISRLVSMGDGMFGLKPRNLEQTFAFDALMDDKVKLVSLIGSAGSGKTLMAIAAALYKTLDDGKYDNIIIARPTVSMGKEIGYLPGTKEEKLLPWMQPFFDNIDSIMSKSKKGEKATQRLIDSGAIVMESLSHIRGRSFINKIMIIDECFPYNQRILTDQGKIRIGKLHMEYIKGKKMPKAMAFNEKTGKFEFKQILNATHKGIRQLCKVYSGNKKIKCTPNHRILTTEGWKKAEDLNCGDYIVSHGHSHQSSLWLNEDQLQVVIGSYLGDGSLGKLSKKDNESLFRLRIQHGIKQIDYLEHKIKILRPLDYKIQMIEKNGFSGKPAAVATTLGFGLPVKIKTETNKNTVDKADLAIDFISKINLKGLAIWFMDDGSKNTENNGGRFHTESVGLNGCQVLVGILKQNFDLDVSIHQSKNSYRSKTYNYLYLNKENYLKLCSLIAPYVIPSMSYKIHNYEQLGGGSKMDSYDSSIPDFSISPVRKVELLNETKHVFDLEVEELHNFVACGHSGMKDNNSGIVAHNCQNVDAHEIKTILSRAGEGTKIILTGDVYQIDTKGLDISNNGLTYATERFLDEKIAANITLTKSERSELAELATKLL